MITSCQMITRTAALLSFLLIISVCCASLAKSSSLLLAQPAQSDSLDAQVKREIAQFKGRVSLFAKNLDTGKTYALDADERVRTASTIKIAVMVEAFARVAAGKAKWTDELVLTKKKKVSGSGILQELSDGLHIHLFKEGQDRHGYHLR